MKRDLFIKKDSAHPSVVKYIGVRNMIERVVRFSSSQFKEEFRLTVEALAHKNEPSPDNLHEDKGIPGFRKGRPVLNVPYINCKIQKIQETRLWN